MSLWQGTARKDDASLGCIEGEELCCTRAIVGGRKGPIGFRSWRKSWFFVSRSMHRGHLYTMRPLAVEAGRRVIISHFRDCSR